MFVSTGTAMITLSTTLTQKEGGRGGGKQGVQSLCQWAEVPGHPGLVTAVMQASNNPVVLMLTPTNIFVQEIKVCGMVLYTPLSPNSFNEPLCNR